MEIYGRDLKVGDIVTGIKDSYNVWNSKHATFKIIEKMSPKFLKFEVLEWKDNSSRVGNTYDFHICLDLVEFNLITTKDTITPFSKQINDIYLKVKEEMKI